MYQNEFLVHRGLLVGRQVVGEVWAFLQGLPESRHIAMTEDPKTPAEQLLLPIIARGVSNFQEFDNGLRRGESSNYFRPP